VGKEFAVSASGGGTCGEGVSILDDYNDIGDAYDALLERVDKLRAENARLKARLEALEATYRVTSSRRAESSGIFVVQASSI